MPTFPPVPLHPPSAETSIVLSTPSQILLFFTEFSALSQREHAQPAKCPNRASAPEGISGMWPSIHFQLGCSLVYRTCPARMRGLGVRGCSQLQQHPPAAARPRSPRRLLSPASKTQLSHPFLASRNSPFLSSAVDLSLFQVFRRHSETQ